MSERRDEQCAISGFPNPGRVILAARDDVKTARTEFCVKDCPIVWERRSNGLTGRCVPNARASVFTCGGYTTTIGTEDRVDHRPIIFQRSCKRHACDPIPQLCGLIMAGGNDAAT